MTTTQTPAQEVSDADLGAALREFRQHFPLQASAAWHYATERAKDMNVARELQQAQPVSADEINALPEKIRRYIHDLETEADPAGTIRQNILVREENEMLRKYIELQQCPNCLNDGCHCATCNPFPGELQQAQVVGEAWQKGYRAGVEDERTSEANIGIAGYGAKIEPARANPYAPPQSSAPAVGEAMAKDLLNEWLIALKTTMTNKYWSAYQVAAMQKALTAVLGKGETPCKPD